MNVDRKIVGVFRTIDDAALVINELNEKDTQQITFQLLRKIKRKLNTLKKNRVKK